MPLDDAIKFIYKDFTNKTKKIINNAYQHPDAIQTLLKTLTDNRSLTVLQYDHIIKYMTTRREVQRKAEIGEDASDMDFPSEPKNNAPRMMQMSCIRDDSPPSRGSSSNNVNKQDELQKKILEILNKKPLMQQIAKKMEVKAKPMTQAEKEELKNKLMQDDKIRQVMTSLRNAKQNLQN